MIGYWLVQELGNAGVAQRAVCVLSQTIVDPSDAAFGHPSKFIGTGYGEDEAQALAARLGWTIAADGPRWRRVVASPRPLGLVEIETIRSLVDAGVLVVCGGGGGVPVARSADGELAGVEAVVDKDLTAAELAITLKADRLLVLTDVPAIIRGLRHAGRAANPGHRRRRAVGHDVPGRVDGAEGRSMHPFRQGVRPAGRDRRADRCRRHPGRPGRHHHQRRAARPDRPAARSPEGSRL